MKNPDEFSHYHVSGFTLPNGGTVLRSLCDEIVSDDFNDGWWVKDMIMAQSVPRIKSCAFANRTVCQSETRTHCSLFWLHTEIPLCVSHLFFVLFHHLLCRWCMVSFACWRICVYVGFASWSESKMMTFQKSINLFQNTWNLLHLTCYFLLCAVCRANRLMRTPHLFLHYCLPCVISDEI